MKYFLTILISLMAEVGYSQNSLGVRNSLLWLKFSTESIENAENNYFAEDIQITRDFDLDIYFTHQRKNFSWIYQVGYRRFIETRELSETEEGTLDVSTRLRTFIMYKIALGIENKVDIHPLTLFYGLEMPLLYEESSKDNFTSDIIDNTNTKIGKVELLNNNPDAIRFGLFANIKFYHFFNKIGVGLEFVNGVWFRKPSKSIRAERNFYDLNGNLTESIIQDKKENRLNINQTSFIGIGIRYKLGE